MRTYSVKEIFGPTIQGEGSHAGAVVMFLRFAGCNKWSGREEDREKSICNYCDTDFINGTPMTAQMIIEQLKDKAGLVDTVVLSGGEPTLQIDDDLLDQLKLAGFVLHLETNGSRALGYRAGMFKHISMSPKQGPSETKLECCDDIKILWPPIDQNVTPEAFEKFSFIRGFLQPVTPHGEGVMVSNLRTVSKLKELNKKHGLPWSMSVQLHKYIGVE